MNLLSKLNILKKTLNNDKLDLVKIQRQINEINTYKELTNYDYLNYLLYPEKYKYVKIPNKISIPSTCLHFTTTKTFSTNCFIISTF